MTEKEKLEYLSNLIDECQNAGFALERDNYGQILLYTGLKFDENGNIIYVSDEDFDEEDDEND